MREWMKALIVILALAGIIFYDSHSYDAKRKVVLKEARAAHTLQVPQRLPRPSQADVNLAMKIFSIKTNENVIGPHYDENLEDRGLTQGTGSQSKRLVLIGPAAFSSWAMLGSTLAHEIEVHMNQSFTKIAMLDLAAPGTPGTHAAEREAYLHEIKCKDRFGLTDTEVEMIEATLNYYYPRSK